MLHENEGERGGTEPRENKSLGESIASNEKIERKATKREKAETVKEQDDLDFRRQDERGRDSKDPGESRHHRGPYGGQR